MTMLKNLAEVSLRGTFVLTFALVLQACTSINTSSENKQDAAQFNAQLGAQYLNRGELDQARDKLTKALDQDDSNALAHASYAQLQFRVKNNAAARDHFKRALKLDPENAEHRNSYGIFLCQIEEYDNALKQFRLAADNPFYETKEFALDNAGICMLDANRLDQAETFLREALREDPQFANAYLHMADLQHRRQRLTIADAYYQRFQEKSNQTSESLLLGLKIKRDSGDLQTAEQFAGRLLNDFPTSKEAGEYLSRPIQ